MSGLIGKKLGMTTIYDQNLKAVACTVVELGPCVVTQVKTKEKDGYEAIQLAYGEKREKNTTQPLMGVFKKAQTTPKRVLKEFAMSTSEYKLGDTITCDKLFAEGDFVDVIGRSKGKGFQGVVKRHGFAGVGGRTHGQHNRMRAPGSMGASSYPSRVLKGKRLGGRTGNERVKMKNLKIVKMIAEKNIIVVSGNVPGAKGGVLLIEK